MSGRRAIIGLCMLCALAISAFAAQSASAVVVGTTAFTCKVPTGSDPTPVGKPFSKGHCKDKEGESDTSESGTFRHVPFAEKTTTDLKVTGEGTGANTNVTAKQLFQTTVGGVGVKLEGEVSAIQGGLENLSESGKHFIHVHNLILKYTGVEEKTLGCKVTGLPKKEVGVIETKELTAKTLPEGHEVQFIPENAEGLFAEFELTEKAGCPGVIKVFGTLKGQLNGATITSTEAGVTAEKSLRVNNKTLGPVAGYEGTATISGKDTTKGDTEFTALSPTTVETP